MTKSQSNSSSRTQTKTSASTKRDEKQVAENPAKKLRTQQPSNNNVDDNQLNESIQSDTSSMDCNDVYIPSLLLLKCEEIIKDTKKFKKFINDNLKARDINVRNIKTTKNNNIQIYFNDSEDFNEVLNNELIFPGKTKVQANKNSFCIVLKGLNYEQTLAYREELEEYGIIGIEQIKSQKNKNQVINKTKLKVQNKQTAEYLLHEGVILDYRKFKIEEYKQPLIKLIQCFKCQKHGHIAKNCKETKTICSKCGSDNHEKDENNKLKCTATTKFCINCQNNHSAAYPFCPKKQEIIQRLTTKKLKETTKTQQHNPQASDIINQPQIQSYANVLMKNVSAKVDQATQRIEKQNNNDNIEIKQKLCEIQETQKQLIEQLTNRIEVLEQKNKYLEEKIEQLQKDQSKVNSQLILSLINSFIISGQKINDQPIQTLLKFSDENKITGTNSNQIKTLSAKFVLKNRRESTSLLEQNTSLSQPNKTTTTSSNMSQHKKN